MARMWRLRSRTLLGIVVVTCIGLVLLYQPLIARQAEAMKRSYTSTLMNFEPLMMSQKGDITSLRSATDDNNNETKKIDKSVVHEDPLKVDPVVYQYGSKTNNVNPAIPSKKEYPVERKTSITTQSAVKISAPVVLNVKGNELEGGLKVTGRTSDTHKQSLGSRNDAINIARKVTPSRATLNASSIDASVSHHVLESKNVSNVTKSYHILPPSQLENKGRQDNGDKININEKDVSHITPTEKGNKLQPVPLKFDKPVQISNRTRYLVYVCDGKIYCYGFGDRQRAMVSLYHLAELTGRKIKIIMTSPVNIRDFYEPNLVDWEVHPSELPLNATSHEMIVNGPNKGLQLKTVNFNEVYPQDIIYLRTNKIFWYNTAQNPVYRNKVPRWAQVHRSHLIGLGWLRLMKPTSLLRSALNDALVEIAQKMQEETDVWKSIGKSNCCKRFSIPKILPPCIGVNGTNVGVCSKNMTSFMCCEKLQKNNYKDCPNIRMTCMGIDTQLCEKSLTSSFPGRWQPSRLKSLSEHFCTSPPPVSTWNYTLDAIRKKTGYELTHFNMICAHIRLGKSSTFSFEKNVINTMESMRGVWQFLKEFAAKGYHIYLASDAQEVKDEAAAIFGERLHMAHQEIVHIASMGKDHDLKAGMLFTLMEQLLLTTACDKMLMSHSGFSGRAVEIRRELMGGSMKDVYKLDKGIISRVY